jgi:hypothetical protein
LASALRLPDQAGSDSGIVVTMPQKLGTCCICGVVGPLSFEHVPPRKAYNDQRVFELGIRHLIESRPDGLAPAEGKWFDGGAGKETLCEKCNNDTGAWYGSAYVNWARQGMRMLDVSAGNLSLSYPYTIYPLRIIKQVAAMFFSACGPEFHKQHPDLVRFVLNRGQLHVPHNLKFYAYFVDPNKSTSSRQSGVSGVLKFDRREQNVFSEIAFAPFGFIMVLSGKPPSLALCDITHFGHEAYHAKGAWFLKLPVLPVVSPLPGDFRIREELDVAAIQNRTLGRIIA